MQSLACDRGEVSVLLAMTLVNGGLTLQLGPYFIESWNHRMAWVEKDHNAHRVSTPPLCAGLPTTRPGCPEPHP